MSGGLRAEQLQVRLGGRRVLDVETLEAPPGAITVLTGSSGSGKTVLAGALAGSIPAAGSILVQERRLSGSPSQRRKLGLAAAVRDAHRLAGCTVEEALLVAAASRDRVAAVLERLPQLASRRQLDAGLLSGGEQQLLQVACAWVAQAAALVLDSPTVGLADDAARAVTELARQAAQEESAVLWLEQDLRAAPEPHAGTLVTGRLEPAAGSSGEAAAASSP